MSTEPEKKRDFSALRLRLGDALAVVAALALLFVMAADWYTTREGERAREIIERAGSTEPGVGYIDEGAVEDARVEAQQAERNAWQLSSAFDLLVLLALLATIALVIAAAGLRAVGREYAEPRRSPIALAGYAALLALLLVLLQAFLRLDPDSPVTIASGLPLGFVALGAIVIGAGLVLRNEAAGAPGTEPPTQASGDRPAPDAAEPEGAATYNRGS